jgi:hypothetical protein
MGADGVSKLKDRALLERAEAAGQVVLTLDKDFWEVALQRPTPLRRSGVLLFRVHPALPDVLRPLVDSTPRAERSYIGHVSVVIRQGIEMIPASGR